MRWEVKTENSTHIVVATSSGDAVKKVKLKDTSQVHYAKLLPKNTVDKLQSIWRRWFGK
jgi:hypothetical protein